MTHYTAAKSKVCQFSVTNDPRVRQEAPHRLGQIEPDIVYRIMTFLTKHDKRRGRKNLCVLHKTAQKDLTSFAMRVFMCFSLFPSEAER